MSVSETEKEEIALQQKLEEAEREFNIRSENLSQVIST